MKYNKASISLTITCIIVAGFLLMAFINYSSYSNIIKDDIENISKLTSTNIYSEITNEITKPIFVSLTMANDSFVKNWMINEEINEERELIEYLAGIKEKYNYNSVFLVSEKTKKYYHYNGVLKTISNDDAHDIWYYDFINQNNIYDLDVDQDEADNHQLTVFVNCKIYDKKNSLIGVTGVGIQMNKIQELLNYYEKNFDLKTFLIDETGLIQAHTDVNLIENHNAFEDGTINRLKQKIIYNKSDMLSFKIKEGIDGYLISRYIQDFDWYLLVKKDTSILKRSLYNQVINDSVIVILVIIIILFIVSKIIKKYQEQLIKMAETDQLTKILNRRAFDKFLKDYIQLSKEIDSFLVFILDIDNFKDINDTYGHVFGDNIIKIVAKETTDYLKEPNVIARWGGDEFSGIIFGNKEDTIKVLYKLKASITNNELADYKISISVGATYYKQTDTADIIFKRADLALYESKKNGKDRITIN